jgi:hypothetical protein
MIDWFSVFNGMLFIWGAFKKQKAAPTEVLVLVLGDDLFAIRFILYTCAAADWGATPAVARGIASGCPPVTHPRAGGRGRRPVQRSGAPGPPRQLAATAAPS